MDHQPGKEHSRLERLTQTRFMHGDDAGMFDFRRWYAMLGLPEKHDKRGNIQEHPALTVLR